jgi:hypothetical protein
MNAQPHPAHPDNPGQNRPLTLVRGRVPHPRNQRYANHRQDELREIAYQKHCVGYSYRAIAAELGINRETVMLYVRFVTAQRAEQVAKDRERQVQESCEFYDVVAIKALEMHDAVRTTLDAIADHAETFEGEVRINEHYLSDALKARERKDKLMGLDAPLKIDGTLRALQEAFFIAEDAPEQKALTP